MCFKALEHILVSNFNSDLAFDSILADCQHGFWGQGCWKTQLIQSVHDIISNLYWAVNQRHKQTNFTVMDFEKAFGNDPHWRLLH